MKNTQNTQPKKNQKTEMKTDNIPNNNIKITDISEYFFFTTQLMCCKNVLTTQLSL